MLPSIDASEVGNTGLVWLLLSYGYVLYFASNMIAEGSDLLLLVPSMAGLVGGVVLPVLASVPDGAIMLFSGLGPVQKAQETLSVGVGTLAGSTIMLLTVSWGLAAWNGRVDLDENTGVPNYYRKPKLTEKDNLRQALQYTGVSLSDAVQRGGIIMAITSIPYFLIQGPAFFIHGPTEELAKGEHWWALAGFIVCITGFVWYLYLQLQISKKGEDRSKRINVMKKLMKKGSVSLSGAMKATLESTETKAGTNGTSYQTVDPMASEIPQQAYDYLKDVLIDAFMKYDTNGDGALERKEVNIFLSDFHESIDKERSDEIFNRMDQNADGTISFDEFIKTCYYIITLHTEEEPTAATTTPNSRADQDAEVVARAMFETTEEEEEEVPKELADLSPEEQQKAIKRKAFTMLFIGTALVVLFSDPVVGVLDETARRLGLSPFYVAFVLAPLASNASEILASQYYAAKKTRATITVSFAELEGAGAMNNTFCLSIFMALIYWRGLAWEYTAETIAILLVEFVIACLVQTKVMKSSRSILILTLFPLSIAFIALLESFGID